MASRTALFPALLKYWRRERGMSQLDFALTADVSTRHLSYMETGRAKPSREMVLRLAGVLGVPLREQNAMLRAAGFEAEFEEPAFDDGLTPEVEYILDTMLKAHEPYPMAIMNRRYDALRVNEPAQRLLASVIADPSALPTPLNLFHILLDERLCKPFVQDWERTARLMMTRLQRECLMSPQDDDLQDLLRSSLEYAPDDWREPDLSTPMDALLTIRLKRDDVELALITMLTVFSAPQNVTLEELRIESYFPADEATRRFFEQA